MSQCDGLDQAVRELRRTVAKLEDIKMLLQVGVWMEDLDLAMEVELLRI